jgi:uncharacterized protein (TIGR03083 family)
VEDEAMTTVAYLEPVWHAWAHAGVSLTDEQWHAPTRLPGWTVADLYAHHSAFPGAILKFCTDPPFESPQTHPDAAALLAMLNRPGGPAHTMSHVVRDRAVEMAQRVRRSELADRFTQTAPQALREAADADPGKLVNYGGIAVLPFGEALRVGLLEAVVHYLDLARAVDLPVPGPVDGAPLRETVRLLAAVADPLEFVERATGRSGVDVLPVVR